MKLLIVALISIFIAGCGKNSDVKIKRTHYRFESFGHEVVCGYAMVANCGYFLGECDDGNKYDCVTTVRVTED